MFFKTKRVQKKLLAGNFNVYAVYDEVSKHYLRLYFNSTDEEFVRLYLPEVVLSTPLRDLSVYCIGQFNDVTGTIEPKIKRRVNIRCYEFPHSRLSPKGESVSHEEIEKTVNDVKNHIQAVSSTVVEETKEEKENVK